MLKYWHCVSTQPREVMLMVTQQEFQRMLQILDVNRKAHCKPVTLLNRAGTQINGLKSYFYTPSSAGKAVKRCTTLVPRNVFLLQNRN